MIATLADEILLHVASYLSAEKLAQLAFVSKSLSLDISRVDHVLWLKHLARRYGISFEILQNKVFEEEILREAGKSWYPYSSPMIQGITCDRSDRELICNHENLSVDFVGRIGESNRSVQGNICFPRLRSRTTFYSFPISMGGAFKFANACFNAICRSQKMPRIVEISEPSISHSVPFAVHAQTERGDSIQYSIRPRSVAYYEVEIKALAPRPAAISRANSFANLLDNVPVLPHELAHMEAQIAEQQQQLQQPVPNIEAATNNNGDAAPPAHEDTATNLNEEEQDDDEGDDGNNGVEENAFECIAVGLATKYFQKHKRLPGWDAESYGYHGDDGAIFHGRGRQLSEYGPVFGVNDTVGCGFDYHTRSIFFTVNGRHLGTAFTNIPTDIDLYPTVGIDANCSVQFNYGMKPFKFDLLGYIKEAAAATTTTTTTDSAMVNGSEATIPTTTAVAEEEVNAELTDMIVPTEMILV